MALDLTLLSGLLDKQAAQAQTPGQQAMAAAAQTAHMPGMPALPKPTEQSTESGMSPEQLMEEAHKKDKEILDLQGKLQQETIKREKAEAVAEIKMKAQQEENRIRNEQNALTQAKMRTVTEDQSRRTKAEAEELTRKTKAEAEETGRQAQMQAEETGRQAQIQAEETSRQARIEAEEIKHQAELEKQKAEQHAQIAEEKAQAIADVTTQQTQEYMKITEKTRAAVEKMEQDSKKRSDQYLADQRKAMTDEFASAREQWEASHPAVSEALMTNMKGAIARMNKVINHKVPMVGGAPVFKKMAMSFAEDVKEETEERVTPAYEYEMPVYEKRACAYVVVPMAGDRPMVKEAISGYGAGGVTSGSGWEAPTSETSATRIEQEEEAKKLPPLPAAQPAQPAQPQATAPVKKGPSPQEVREAYMAQHPYTHINWASGPRQYYPRSADMMQSGYRNQQFLPYTSDPLHTTELGQAVQKWGPFISLATGGMINPTRTYRPQSISHPALNPMEFGLSIFDLQKDPRFNRTPTNQLQQQMNEAYMQANGYPQKEQYTYNPIPNQWQYLF